MLHPFMYSGPESCTWASESPASLFSTTFGVGDCMFSEGSGKSTMTNISSMTFNKAAPLLTASSNFGFTRWCQKKAFAGFAGPVWMHRRAQPHCHLRQHGIRQRALV